ncbi:MAG: hypothetical protein UW22_C0005G0001 [Candidatus Gottesmanbacteria bacterium GW2011_GWB1_44_11c]|uniref:Uncharacterized protein n=2 Tax=Candidatus Gottesmaniibacteriota TaxID=1752720 RepID=A0A0G1IPZ2_9BACT|nr:MAG: hypothetical protein UW22_C0005G0001 [Candidatus Gottesmanbacteria bacterium GW2011_GWB1_44_11c]KKT61200.1 MAG: hypothetical protein UW52_C0008G0006 [Candidatus Gottesmanbacteria bacterium GW2011_GWA1_44_24b]HCM82015.1 hypothetical protein [Patescibacteria group bacterium]
MGKCSVNPAAGIKKTCFMVYFLSAYCIFFFCPFISFKKIVYKLEVNRFMGKREDEIGRAVHAIYLVQNLETQPLLGTFGDNVKRILEGEQNISIEGTHYGITIEGLRLAGVAEEQTRDFLLLALDKIAPQAGEPEDVFSKTE